METGKRLDVRLESFLRRNLSREDYDRLYTSEPCVVLSPGEKKVHRYAILGHDQIYTLEIPPKKLRTALRLEEITSIQLLHDLPNFLSGEEQLNTVHIQVAYRKSLPSKGSIKDSSASSSAQQLSPSAKLPPTGGGVAGASSTSPGSDAVWSQTTYVHAKGMDGLKGESLSAKRRATSLKNKSSSPIQKFMGGERMSMEELFGSSQSNSTSSSVVGLDKEGEEGSPLHGQSMDRLLFPGQGSEGDGRHMQLSLPDLSITPTISHNTHSSSSSSVDVGGARSVEESSSAVLAASMEAVLDLYILKQKTDFYDQIMVAWNDTKIRQILEQSTAVSPQKPMSNSTEYFYHKFSTLREELLGAADLDSCTLLCHELSTAAQKYFMVKILFWEDTDLLNIVLQLLMDRLSHCNVKAIDLEEQFEHAVVLMDLLYQVLRETHSLNQRRLANLFQDGGLMVLSLSTVLTRHFHLLVDPLDSMLVAEIVEKACGVLYEVFQAVEQTRWLQCAGRFRVSCAWLVDRIVQEGKIEDFLAKLVNYASEVLAINPKGPGPQEQVTLYHVGIVLLTILRNSPSQVLYFKKHFTEEFKYYIARRNTQAKLPSNSPLTKSTLDVLQACSDRVLH